MAAAAAERLLDELGQVEEKTAAFAAAREARLELLRLRRKARRSAKRCCDASTVMTICPDAEQVLRDLRRATQQARDAAAQEKRMLRLLAAAAQLRAAVLRLKARLGRRGQWAQGLSF